ncbi:MAG: AAA family ATPase [Candidatus Eremiobacteraeota bacterium]|nr:AAA family ATPase [Candidatus Eremiobacteraeota bacterium]
MELSVDDPGTSLRFCRLPKLTPNTLTRPRLLSALALYSDAPTRALIAPPGFGKSTLVRQYLAEVPFVFDYIAFHAFDGPAEVLARTALAFGIEPTALDPFIDSLADVSQRFVVFDDVDVADPRATATLREIIEYMPDHHRIIVCARSRNVVSGARSLVSGTVAYINADELAFTPAELASLCDLHNVSYTNDDVLQFWSQTEGWPIVANLAIRSAGLQKRPAATLYAAWREMHAESFRCFVLEESERSPHSILLRRLLTSDDLICKAEDWDTLERHGLFARRRNGRVDIYRTLLDVFSHTASHAAEGTNIDCAPIMANVLGEFSVVIGGRPVQWVRRKDARVFKYLILKPGGEATRQELLDVFWPNSERQTAIAALRTACSQIRHALREAVGFTRAQAYFKTDLHVRVPVELVITDLQRIRAHTAAALEAEKENDLKRACTHWEKVVALDSGDFVVDVQCAQYHQIAKELETAYSRARALLRSA